MATCTDCVSSQFFLIWYLEFQHKSYVASGQQRPYNSMGHKLWLDPCDANDESIILALNF